MSMLGPVPYRPVAYLWSLILVICCVWHNFAQNSNLSNVLCLIRLQLHCSLNFTYWGQVIMRSY